MSTTLVVVGLNHRSAPVELRERLAVAAEALDEAVRAVRALPGVDEALFLATCNRVEVYAAGADPAVLASSLRTFLAGRGEEVGPCLYEHRDEAAVRHAFRVCASLDSMVVGEPQILGQVKEAFATARASGATGAMLGRLFPRAFQAAKRVRTETGIASGQVSVASIAVDLARGIFGDLGGRRVLLVGAGKMALGAARSLVRQGATLAVANRSYERAVELAGRHGGTAHPLTDLALLLQHADVVICSTAATRFVVTREELGPVMRSRRGRSLFLVDITVPRNVDPRAGDLDNVYLYNVDDLERIVAEATKGRTGAASAAEQVLADELRAWARERRGQGVAPTIAALRERFRATAQAELERSLNGRLRHLGEDERRALEVMLDAMVNKLLHAPTISLRAHAETPEGPHAIAMVRELFALVDGDAAPAGTAGEGTR